VKDFKPSQIILTFMAATLEAVAVVLQLIAKGLWYVGTGINKMITGTTNSDS